MLCIQYTDHLYSDCDLSFYWPTHDMVNAAYCYLLLVLQCVTDILIDISRAEHLMVTRKVHLESVKVKESTGAVTMRTSGLLHEIATNTMRSSTGSVQLMAKSVVLWPRRSSLSRGYQTPSLAKCGNYRTWTRTECWTLTSLHLRCIWLALNLTALICQMICRLTLFLPASDFSKYIKKLVVYNYSVD